MKPHATARGLAKVLVVLLTFGSFLGIASTPATAADAEWTIEVQVTDLNPAPPECVSTITAATWQPNATVSYIAGGDNTRDKSDAPPLMPVMFDVWLDFRDGGDTCDPTAAIVPTGTITSALSNISPQLEQSSLDCETPCGATSLPDERGDVIRGALQVLDTAVGGQTYQATLTVVWTP